MKILALDLGRFNTMRCFFDTKTRKHSFFNATTDRNYLLSIFKKHRIDLVVMEPCGPSGWINDLAMGQGLKSLVCSKRSARMILALYDCARSLVLDRARLRYLWPESMIRTALRMDAKCRPTSAWFHASSNPAKPIATDALLNAAIRWHARFLSNVLGPRCFTTPQRHRCTSTAPLVGHHRHSVATDGSPCSEWRSARCR